MRSLLPITILLAASAAGADSPPADQPATPAPAKVAPASPAPPANVLLPPAASTRRTPIKVVPHSAAEGSPSAPAAPTGPAGTLEIKETVFDAGKIERGGELKHEFVLKNVGKGDLEVVAKPG